MLFLQNARLYKYKCWVYSNNSYIYSNSIIVTSITLCRISITIKYNYNILNIRIYFSLNYMDSKWSLVTLHFYTWSMNTQSQWFTWLKDETRMFLEARSLCTMFLDSRYIIPLAIWVVHIFINSTVSNVVCSFRKVCIDPYFASSRIYNE